MQTKRLERKRKPPARRSLIPKKKSRRNLFEKDIAYSLLSLSEPVHLPSPKLDTSHTYTKTPEKPRSSEEFQDEFSVAQILASLAENANLKYDKYHTEQEPSTPNYIDGDPENSIQVYYDCEKIGFSVMFLSIKISKASYQ